MNKYDEDTYHAGCYDRDEIGDDKFLNGLVWAFLFSAALYIGGQALYAISIISR